MIVLKRIFFFGLLLCLTACASVMTYPGCDVPAETGMPILHPSALNAQLVASQQVMITTPEDRFEFISQLEVNKDKLIFVAMTPIGQKLFQIQYARKNIRFERFGIPDTFNPAYLLADISLIYGDAGMLNTCYQQAGLPVNIIDSSNLKRTIKFPGQQAISVSYSVRNKWMSNIVFTNPVRNYTISIKSLGVDRL